MSKRRTTKDVCSHGYDAVVINPVQKSSIAKVALGYTACVILNVTSVYKTPSMFCSILLFVLLRMSMATIKWLVYSCASYITLKKKWFGSRCSGWCSWIHRIYKKIFIVAIYIFGLKRWYHLDMLWIGYIQHFVTIVRVLTVPGFSFLRPEVIWSAWIWRPRRPSN